MSLLPTRSVEHENELLVSHAEGIISGLVSQRLRNGKNDGIGTNLDDVFHWSVQTALAQSECDPTFSDIHGGHARSGKSLVQPRL